ncbi:MFS transporter, partial [Streptomyces sp. TRM76130]|nr:MFS transporter [Streptomyces sp. TRM76130]
CSLGMSVLGVRLGRRLTEVQDRPWLLRTGRVVRQGGAPAEPEAAARA